MAFVLMDSFFIVQASHHFQDFVHLESSAQGETDEFSFDFVVVASFHGGSFLLDDVSEGIEMVCVFNLLEGFLDVAGGDALRR